VPVHGAIHAPDRSSGKRRQKAEIYYKAAGIINISENLCVARGNREETNKKAIGGMVSLLLRKAAVQLIAVPPILI